MSKNKNHPNMPTLPAKPADVEEAAGFDDFDAEEGEEAAAPDAVDERSEAEWDENAAQVSDPADDPVTEVFTKIDGTVIPIKCSNCKMWNTPHAFLGNRVMCKPGKLVKVVIDEVEQERPMSEELWSCRAYFVPRDMDLSLPESVGQAAMVRKLGAYLKAGVAAHLKAVTFAAEFDEDLAAVRARLLSVASTLTTEDDLTYVFPLVQFLCDNILRQHRNAGRVRKPSVAKVKFNPGDVVEWTDEKTGSKLDGWIMVINNRASRIKLMLSDKAVAVVQADATKPFVLDYDYQKWLAMNPVVMQAASVEVVDAPAEEA